MTLNDKIALNMHFWYFDGSRVSISFAKGKFHVIDIQLSSRPSASFDTEAEALRYGLSLDHCMLAEMANSEFLQSRLLSLYCDLLVHTPSILEQKKRELNDELVAMFHVVVDSFGAEIVSKAKLQARPVKPSATLSWLKMGAKVLVPGSSTVLNLDVKFLPSPFYEKSFDMRVRIESSSNDEAQKFYGQVQAAERHLSINGYSIGDVLAGQRFDL